MRRAALCLALALTVLACNRNSYGVATHRGRDGQPDQWVNRLSADEYQLSIDTNGDGKPDVIKTIKGDKIIEVQSDRNFDGQIDLVQQYSNGVLIKEVHDDDFDGKPEAVRTFRPDGSLAIIERDPGEHGAIDIVEYYDASGHLTRREARKK